MALRSRTKMFIKPDEKLKQVGSILLADAAQSTVERGTVVYSCVDDIKEGDRVVYDKSLAMKFEDELIVLDEEDVWAVEQ